MGEKPEWFEDTLARQLEMTPQTWSQLREAGVDEATELALEFAYDAPGQEEAQRLADFLAAETDYEVAAGDSDGWEVVGKTKPEPVNEEKLRGWVEWMVTAGAERGPCKFDGWGAEVP